LREKAIDEGEENGGETPASGEEQGGESEGIAGNTYVVSTGWNPEGFGTIKIHLEGGKKGEDPELKTVPIKEAFQNFIHNVIPHP